MQRQRKRNRLAGFNYASDGFYFVTICTKSRVHHFGVVNQGEMLLTEWGRIALERWQWLEQQYPYVALHAFVVMPNHVHGILQIDRSRVKGRWIADEKPPRPHASDEVPIKIKSLSELMGAYKTTASKQIHLAGNAPFSWQRSFYDHIVRNEEAFQQISRYIVDNPLRWQGDCFAGPDPDDLEEEWEEALWEEMERYGIL